MRTFARAACSAAQQLKRRATALLVGVRQAGRASGVPSSSPTKERREQAPNLDNKRIKEVTAMPLFYLLSLQHVTLPKVVTRPEDVQHVSVLKATGLIEAEIAPASDAAGKYNAARTATVTRITEDGFAEINKMLNEPRRMERTLQLVRNRMRSSALS
jgi:hypothetical protein